MDIRLGGRRFRYDFDALGSRVLNAAWPYFGRLDRRSRLGSAIAFAVLLHLLLLWLLLAEHPRPWDMPHWQDETPPPPVDLWTPAEPVPEEATPPNVPRVTPHEIPTPEAPKPQPQTEPQPQASPKTETDIQPQPALAPSPSVPSVQPSPAPQITVPTPTPDVKPLPTVAPAPVADTPRSTSMSLKTKKKDQDDNLQKMEAAPGQVSDLNLHQVPADIPTLSAATPSGATPATPGSAGSRAGAAGSAAGGAAAGGGKAGGLPGGLSGLGLNGRGALSQALQNHDYCVDKQINGKPIPKDCHMPDLASAKPLGPKPVPQFDAELARRKAMAQPGNADYWRRVNQGAADPAHDDHRPRPGEYQSGKAARVMGECSQTDSCTNDMK